MKAYFLNFINIAFLLLIESVIVSSLLIFIYRGTNDCPWDIYKGYIFKYLLEYLLMKLIIFLVPLTLFVSLTFKEFYALKFYKQTLVYFFLFLFVHVVLTIFFKGGRELGLPECVPLYVNYSMVYGAVLASPFICKMTGITKLLMKMRHSTR